MYCIIFKTETQNLVRLYGDYKSVMKTYAMVTLRPDIIYSEVRDKNSKLLHQNNNIIN